MQTGDPKKAVVLGAVAIVIVGVAVFQIVPKGAKPLAQSLQRAEGSAAAAVEKKTNAALPNTLTSSPFVAPKAPEEKKDPLDAAGKGADGKKSGIANPLAGSAFRSGSRVAHFGGGDVPPLAGGDSSLPPVNPLPAGPLPTKGGVEIVPEHPAGILDVQPPDGKGPLTRHPSENAGPDRQISKENSKTLTLSAILQVQRRIAVVTIDGNEDMPRNCEAGSTIEGYKILAISDSSIIIERGKNTLQVNVGSTVHL